MTVKKMIIMIQNEKEYQRIITRMQKLYGLKKEIIISV